MEHVSRVLSKTFWQTEARKSPELPMNIIKLASIHQVAEYFLTILLLPPALWTLNFQVRRSMWSIAWSSLAWLERLNFPGTLELQSIAQRLTLVVFLHSQSSLWLKQLHHHASDSLLLLLHYHLEDSIRDSQLCHPRLKLSLIWSHVHKAKKSTH